LMYSCDEFTKNYYRVKFGVSDFSPIDSSDEDREAIQKVCSFERLIDW